MFNKHLRVSGLLALVPCLAALALPGYGKDKDKDKHRADLSRLVVVGDSLSAGVENYALLDYQQVHGYAKVIADQAHVPLVLPLIPYPGIPNKLELVSVGPPPVVTPVPGTLPAIPRDNPFAIITNLSVPGQTVSDALNKRPTANVQTAIDEWTNAVLGYPAPFLIPFPAQTQIERAKILFPTTVIVELGNNDALLAAITGILPLTPLDNFTASYTTVLDELKETRATLIVANIPDITELPFFTSVTTLAKGAGAAPEVIAGVLGLGVNDLLRPGAVPIAYQILTGGKPGPLPAACPSPIPGLPFKEIPCVLNASDAAALSASITAYNAVIGRQAAAHKATVVDLHALVDTIHANGYKIGRTKLTTDFLGGLFSLDGIHPTNTAYGVIANEFIRVMNSKLGTEIHPADVSAIAHADPLVFNIN